ncbi:MAG: PAS domain-containing protein, partial [Myxococcales bacterium]|nr:PAS domain-containing protein [Myxococcales bacterium]
AALDRLPMGVIMVDEDGVVIARNRAAATILDQRDGLVEDQGVLQGGTHAQTLALHRIVRAALADEIDENDRSLTLNRPSGRRPLELVVVPAEQEEAEDGQVVTLFVTDPAGESETDPRLLQRIYGLTRAESNFAALLAKGKKVEEVAETLHISLHTARGHLKNIFAKTSTNRQANLVRLLVTGPAQLRLGA